MAWTDEQKEQLVADYVAAEPTAENSMEIVEELAAEMDQSPNGARIILSRAGVYIKKGSATNAKSSGGGGSRVSKADAQKTLSDAIDAVGGTVDESIIEKLTGKAAVYLAGIINNTNE